MHTQAYAQVDESLETGGRGALEQWMHCVAKKPPNKPHIQCASVFWDEFSRTKLPFQKDRLHGSATAISQLEKTQRKKDIESYHYDSAFPL